MKLKASLYLMAASAIAALSSCSNDSDYSYVPGEVVSPDCPAVYFAASNPVESIFSPDEEAGIVIKVGRIRTTGELTVPILASDVAEGIKVPSSVTFADGEAEAQLIVDASGIPAGSIASYTVAFPSEYINPYAKTPGIGSFTGRIACAEWKLWADNVEFTFEDRYDPIYGQIYELQGVGKYYIPNFLNTGLDLYFTMENSKSNGAFWTIDPYRNADVYYDADYEYTHWYLYDEANDDFPIFNIQPGADAIEYMEFFGIDTSSNYYYTYICPNDNYGVFSGLFYYEDGSSDYNDVTFTW